MDYNALIEQTKKALESYSNADAELEELYRKAKEKNSKSYELAKNQLNEQYGEDKNQAVAKAELGEKDMNEFLAARGLSTSGESVQAKVDSDVSVNNSLSALAKKNNNSLAELEKEKLDKESELDTSLAEKKLELSKEKNTLADSLEQLKKSIAESNTVKKTSTGSSKISIDNNTSKTGTENKKYTPSTSAKDMAKSILASYTSDGKISTGLQKSRIKKYLQSLIKKDGVGEDYIKDVIFNLETYGYTDISDSYADSVIAADSAKTYYDKVYNDFYDIYIKGNRTSEKAGSMAKSKARNLMLDYIYERSNTIASFESTSRQAGVSQSELDEYYMRLGNIINNGEKIVLGSKIN